jgi:hypothetical protein
MLLDILVYGLGFAFIFVLFLLMAIGDSSGGLQRVSKYKGYRGLPGLQRIYVGNAKPPKHGSAHHVCSLDEMIKYMETKERPPIKYYNANTDEFQDEKPEGS